MAAISLWLSFPGSLNMARRNARSDPPPHRRWRRVLNSKSKSWPNIYQAQVAQLQKPRPRSPDLPPLYLSPGPRTFRRADPKTCCKTAFGTFFSFFGRSETAFKICFEKSSKKCENRGFQLSETLPKSFQNASEIDVPTNMRFFIDFCFKEPL